MAPIEPKTTEIRPGLTLDIWCDPEEEYSVLTAELSATGPEDKKRAALLLYELGRVHIVAGNEPAAAKAFLQAYTLRPRFRPTLRLAQRMYRQRGDFKLAVKLLEAEARATRDPLTRTALLRQQARVLWCRLKDLPEACRILEQAYRIDAADLATLKFQELLYAIDRDPDRLRSALLRQLESVSDMSLQVALLVDLAMLVATSDTAASVDTLRSAEKGAPGDLTVLCHLEQVFELAGMYPELAQTIIEQAKDEQAAPGWRGRQLARAARIHRDQIKDHTAALDLFHASLSLAAEFSVATDCFDLLLQEQRWEEAVQVGEQLFGLDDTASFKASLSCQIGDLYRVKLSNHPAAATWYVHCLKWSPTYQPALEGLGWILEQAGEVDRLLEVHRTDLGSVVEPRARAQRLYRIASLLERHRRDPEAMAAHKEALAASPDFQPSISALERLYTRYERWTELLQLYDEELRRASDRERVQHILETMASIWYHQLEDTDNAIACYRKILELDSSHLPTIRALARLSAETRRWHDLVDLNEREIAVLKDPRRRVELLQRTGEVWEDQLLNLDKAMECYRHALETDPRHLPALRALGRLYRQKGRWEQLIIMHRAEIRATDDPEQILDILYDIAEIFEEHLLDEKQAAAIYREILGRRPGHLPALAALERILKRQSDWQGLVELMDAGLDAIGDVRGQALQLWRMGVLREEQLGDHQGAIKDYARALRLAPDLAPAQAALEQTLEEIGDHHQLAELLAAAMEQTEQPEVRAEITHRLADLWEHALQNPQKAALLYEKAAESNPTSWCLYSLVQIYERLAMPRELCGVLERLADHLNDDEAATELQLKIGRIKLMTGFGDPIPHLARAIELPSARNFAQRATERALRAAGMKAELLDLIGGRIEAVSDPLEAACLWTELAELHLGRGDVAAAEQAYRQALLHSEGHPGALHGLGQILEQQERWTELAELAEAEANAMESSGALCDALVRAAILWEEKAGDVQRALPLYRQVLRVQHGHQEAYRRLHALAIAEQDWASMASLIRARISAVNDPRETAGLFIELGRLYLEHLGQSRKGEACLRRTLEMDPLNVFALTKLGDIYFEAGKWTLAQRMYGRLEPLINDPAERVRVNHRLGDVQMALNDPVAALEAYQRAMVGVGAQDPDLLRKTVHAAAVAHDPRAQVAALERLAECSADAEERVAVRKEVAQLAETVLDNDELAVRALEEALVLDPLDIEAIERLAAIYGRASKRSAANQHLQAAVAYHRAELARRPFDLRLYRQVGRIFQWQRLFDRLYCACVVQFHLGELEEVQQRFLWTHHRRCGLAPKGPLPRSRFELLILPEAARGPIRDLLSAAGRGLQRRAAVNPASLGVDKSSRIKGDIPLRAFCDEVAALLGGVDFDLCISRTQPDLITAEMLSEPTLVLGERVAKNMLTAVERFRIGRALFLIAENALVLRDLSVREITHMLVALGQVAQPSCKIPLSVRQQEQVDEEARGLSKLLTRRDRKVIGGMLPQLVERLEAVNVAEFARALGFGANRTGLAAAGDPKVGLEEAAQLVGSHDSGPEMADLLQYMISEEYFTLRLELGMAPGSG